MTKKIYMSRFSDHINQRFANLIIHEQFLI